MTGLSFKPCVYDEDSLIFVVKALEKFVMSEIPAIEWIRKKEDIYCKSKEKTFLTFSFQIPYRHPGA